MTQQHLYFFAISRIKPSRIEARRMRRIAAKYGAAFVEDKIPHVGYKRWFYFHDGGEPYNSTTEKAILAEVADRSRG